MNIDSPALSVVMPVYNAAGTIAAQLDALARQRWSKPWEVIVVNNRSTDDSIGIVRRFGDAIPSLRIVDAPAKPGAAHAINIGVRAARGTALAFCDADDVVADGWIAAMGEGLRRLHFVSGPLETEYLNRGAPFARSNPQPTGIQEYRDPPFLPHAAAANMGVRRDVFDAFGGFDESMMAVFETDFCWRVQLGGIALTPVPGAVVHYRFRRSLKDTLTQAQTYAQYNVLLYKRYRPLGMPRLSPKRAARAWVRLLRGVPGIVTDPGKRGHWMWSLGWRVGRLHGSVKYRVFSP